VFAKKEGEKSLRIWTVNFHFVLILFPLLFLMMFLFPLINEHGKAQAKLYYGAHSLSSLDLLDLQDTQWEEEEEEEEEEEKEEDIPKRSSLQKPLYHISLSFTSLLSGRITPVRGFYGRGPLYRFMADQVNQDIPEAEGLKTFKLLSNKFQENNPQIDLKQFTIFQKEKFLRDYVLNFSGIEIPENLLLSEIAIAHAIENPTHWKEDFSRIKNHITFDQKILIASYLGGKFSSQYNSQRAKDDGDGVISIEQMLFSVKNNIPGGVCRDVVIAQTEILMVLGIPKEHIYQVSYTTARKRHSTVLVKDQNNPRNILIQNYDHISQSNGATGTSAIFQNSAQPDFGFQNNVYDADGNSLGALHTELGEILYEVTGGNEGRPTPVTRHSLVKVALETPLGRGKIFSGKTLRGDTVEGVTLRKDFLYQKGKTNLALVGLQREGERSYLKLIQQALYIRLKSALHGPSLTHKRFSLNSTAGVEMETMIMQNKIKRRGKITADAGHIDSLGRPYLSLSTLWRSKTNKTRWKTDVLLEGIIHNSHIGQYALKDPALVFNMSTIHTEIAHQLTHSLVVVAEAGMKIRPLGTSVTLTTGLLMKSSDKKTILTTTYAAPTDKDVPIFLPESQTTLQIGIGQSYRKSNLYYQIKYSRNLDTQKSSIDNTLGLQY